jgi:hypothetical protein
MNYRTNTVSIAFEVILALETFVADTSLVEPAFNAKRTFVGSASASAFFI